MGYIRFEYPRPLLIVRLRVGGITANNFHSLIVGLDTGATITTIPTKVAIALGYDLSKPKRQQQIVTGNGIVAAKIITVSRLTAIGETVENIDVLCHNLPTSLRVEGLLGLNFLEHFDLNISFSTRTIEIHPR